MKKVTMSIVVLLMSGATLLQAAGIEAPGIQETKEQRDARMAWWHEAKFGLFIHWGVYSVPAGYYHGKPVNRIGEWIMCNAKIPMAEYQQFAKEFNPVKFNADEWVKMAKDAGMKYIVITSKHHDGFAMYPSKASKWNIYDATPWKHDPLQELAEACRKYGIKLGFYYSQAQDWNNGGAAMRGKWDPAQEHDMDDYIDKIAVPQVKELLTHYGEFPAILWWDTPGREPRPIINHEQAKKLYDKVEQLRPGIIMNDRLGGGYEGDTITPEQRIPPEGYPGKDWETCMTMNNTWGFKKDDHNWKSTEVLIRNLCDIASKGGNYLLNVGPTSEGLIPEPSIERLNEVGDWMKVNGEAIYGSTKTPFHEVHGTYAPGNNGRSGRSAFTPKWDWRCTSKPGKLYLMIFDWPKDGVFKLTGLESRVTRAALLDGGQELKFNQQADGVAIDLPKEAPDKIASVVRVEIADVKAKVAGNEVK